MLRKIKKAIRYVMNALLLLVAFVWYGVSKKMPSWTGRAHIMTFCLTAGRSNDWMSKMLSFVFPPRKIDIETQVFSPLSDEQLRQVTDDLDQNGYVILNQRLPEQLCERLMQFALTQEAVLRQTDGQSSHRQTGVYDADNPRAVIYDFEKASILANPEVQALLMDPTLLSIAQSYFRSEPVADLLSMWWSTAYKGTADGEAAQLYHFDMDRVKWLKVFVYLTDVGKDNGPHYFVSGSHRSGGIPRELLARGYARLEDEDISRHYAPHKVVEFAAPKGTIIIEDTRGLHKGQHIKEGHRLILQFQISNSRFGAEIPPAPIATSEDSVLARAVRRHPRMFSGYTLNT
ncbi:phytanoyl-CoA dioxygenase family protein [Herbaspirillum rhizosphaerae]|uniref:phytanoyl-CoA dioxygenase family protein n=1 Tax=Herbaspirillum rhizosphaerae TaxID=346179 RepID=UPI00067CD69D|nr:phytanoyl-CoA dioxygenase family protein [Herbaspirillum rhizosphaerae]